MAPGNRKKGDIMFQLSRKVEVSPGVQSTEVRR